MLLTRIFVSLSVLARAARGGSSLWQPQLQVNDYDVVLAADESGYAVKDAVFRRDLPQKRYLAIKPDAWRDKWPGNTINYCYESTAARRNVHKFLIAADNWWRTAGLVSERYKYREIYKPGSACTGHEDRHRTLVIGITPVDGTPATTLGYATVGLEALDEDAPDYHGPVMYINPEGYAGYGKSRFISTIAHELGHVWGLYHEHQNQRFWGSPYSARQGQVFGKNFHCDRFPGYARAREEIKTKFPNDPAALEEQTYRMCTFISEAQKYNFAAQNFLPETTAGPLDSPTTIPNTGATNEHVDWTSIMIYAGEDVLLKNDGSSFGWNERPSQGDVAGIKKIYGDTSPTHQNPTLHSSPKSPFYTKWKDMVKKKLCR